MRIWSHKLFLLIRQWIVDRSVPTQMITVPMESSDDFAQAVT